MVNRPYDVEYSQGPQKAIRIKYRMKLKSRSISCTKYSIFIKEKIK